MSRLSGRSPCTGAKACDKCGRSATAGTGTDAPDPDALRGWAGQPAPSGPHAELVALLERELTVADGELTPSLKVRRAIVEESYRDRLDALYR